MKLSLVVADAGRPGSSGNISLLNAGWTFTTATPVDPPDQGWLLPAQAVCVFLASDWDELNRTHKLVVELMNEDGEIAQLSQGPGNFEDARIEHDMAIPSIAGAPNGTPGRASFLVDIPGGGIRVPRAPGWYKWRATIGSTTAEVGFWVNTLPTPPKVG
ncbi:MAG TPA: hypothetical protein VHX40_05515 [Acidimicrobiales bacterium]|nr:hypothetical protein [Acidimicrobiales bacterium]